MQNTDIEMIRLDIAEKTGIPANILMGETEEEIQNYANALLSYKQEELEKNPPSKVAQFEEWFNKKLREKPL